MKAHSAIRFRTNRANAPNSSLRGNSAQNRRAVIALEFLLSMPILFVVTLAAFQFGILGLVIQAGTTAVMEAAREGAKAFPSTLVLDNNPVLNTDPTGDDDIADKIALIVDDFLAVHCLEVRQSGVSDDATKANAVVLIDRGGTTATRGDTTVTCNRTGTAAGATGIVVTICFNLVDSTNPTGHGNPVPDWLSSFNLSISTCRFEMTSRANLE